ncbi:MAG: hypothetical protein RSH52_24195 [Janthinobacterium sp.]
MGGALVRAIIDRQNFYQIEINQQRRSSAQHRDATAFILIWRSNCVDHGRTLRQRKQAASACV